MFFGVSTVHNSGSLAVARLLAILYHMVMYHQHVGSSNITLPIQSLTTMNATLPIGDRRKYAVFNELVDPDCVWIFGGWIDRNSFYCYNMTSDSIYTYMNLTNDVNTLGMGAFFIDKLLYYYTGSNKIIRMDILNKQETVLGNTQSPLTSYRVCMAQYPYGESNTTFFFIAGGATNNPNEFYMYNASSNFYTQGPTMEYGNGSYSRNIAQCITHNEYLYVFGNGDPISRINLISYVEAQSTS